MSKINKIKVNDNIYDIEDVNKPGVLLLKDTINLSSPITDANILTLVKNEIIKAYNNNTPLKIIVPTITYYASTYPSVVFDEISAETNRIYVRTTNSVFSSSANFTNFGIKYSSSCNFTMMFSVDATELANHALTDLYDLGTTTPLSRLTISTGGQQCNAVYETTALIGKNNTSSWTPTQNYGLVHKKYVDDSIAAAITTTLNGSY
jgi:hypothetical protein